MSAPSVRVFLGRPVSHRRQRLDSPLAPATCLPLWATKPPLPGASPQASLNPVNLLRCAPCTKRRESGRRCHAALATSAAKGAVGGGCLLALPRGTWSRPCSHREVGAASGEVSDSCDRGEDATWFRVAPCAVRGRTRQDVTNERLRCSCRPAPERSGRCSAGIGSISRTLRRGEGPRSR
jgi:hypothetical protein